jgi:aldehyde:ferredoxin oxidoreductase
MVQILTVRLDHGHASVSHVPWPITNGPISASVANALARHAGRDWLIIGKGPLSGRHLVGSAVATITAPSAQGPGLAEAQVEGPLAHGLTRLGIDAVVIIGVATGPVGIVCEGFGDSLTTTITDATHLEAVNVFATDDALRTSPHDIVITTGVWGMAEHPGASVVTNRGFPTTQGGLGAVCGRLRLNHLVLRGSGQIPAASEQEQRITDDYEAAIAGNPLTSSEKNFPGFAMWVSGDLVGYQGSPGFSGRTSTGAEAFSADDMMAFARDEGTHACPGCPQSCLKAFTYQADTPADSGRAHQLGVSSGALAADISGADLLVRFNEICHDLGVEHLSAADALRGRPITGETFDDDIRDALHHHRPGSDPSLRVKGMVVPPFDPRGNQGLGVGFALNPTGPRYDVLEHDIDFEAGQHWMGRDRLEEDFGVEPGGIPMGTLGPDRLRTISPLWLAWSALDALGLCEFAAPPTRELTIEAMCEVATKLSGDTVTRDDYTTLGKLRLALLRDTSWRLGATGEDDTLPDVFFDQPVADGRLVGAVVDREEFAAACEVVRGELGWNPRGGVADVKLLAQVEQLSDDVWQRLESVAT